MEELKEDLQGKNLITEMKAQIKRLHLYLIGSFALVVLLVVINVVFNQTTKYFRVDPMGRIEPLVTQELHLTEENLYAFADDVILRTFNYSYRNLDTHFHTLSHFYTDFGMKNMNKAWQESGLFSDIAKNKVTHYVAPTALVYRIEAYDDNMMVVYRSYASERITNRGRKEIGDTVYQIFISKDESSNRWFYKLKVENVKEMTLKLYQERYNIAG